MFLSLLQSLLISRWKRLACLLHALFGVYVVICTELLNFHGKEVGNMDTRAHDTTRKHGNFVEDRTRWTNVEVARCEAHIRSVKLQKDREVLLFY